MTTRLESASFLDVRDVNQAAMGPVELDGVRSGRKSAGIRRGDFSLRGTVSGRSRPVSIAADEHQNL
jgi:hypothetical protein